MQRALAVIVAALTLAALSLGLLSTTQGRLWELRALDSLMVQRYLMGFSPTVDPRIVIVDLTEQDLDKPHLFMMSDYASAIENLEKVGVLAIGFDILPAFRSEALPPEVLPLVERGELALAERIAAGKTVLIKYLDQDGQTRRPPSQILNLMALAHNRLAAANVHTDEDGVVRRLPIVKETWEGAESAGTLSMRVLEVAGLEGPETPSLENHYLRINYPGPGHLFRRIGFREALNGQLAPDLAGSIVFIGATDPTFQDLVVTPMRLLGRDQPGVEVHASAANTVLTRNYLSVPDFSTWLLYVAGLCAVILIVARRWSPTASVLGTLAALLLWSGGSLLALCVASYWLPVTALLLAGLPAFAIGSLDRYRSVEKERIRVRGILGRFVSEPVMHELLNHPESLQLGGTRRTITVLFSDINEFTPVCEGKQPEEIIAMLNDYFEEMGDIIFRHRGTLKQFVGDEIMVIFGAPEQQDDHAARAVRTAVEMVERLEALAQESPKGFHKVKIGVHTGEAVVGTVGAARRSEYAAVGDNVNLAARIEGLAKTLGTSLLVSEATKQAAEADLPEFDWTSCGPQSFKGKQEQTVVYKVKRKEPE
jgi:adenylate cyclase